MQIVSPPKLTPMTEKEIKEKLNFTKVTFKPDLPKFGMNKLTGDVIDLMRRRLFDLAGTNNSLNVFFNGEQVKLNFNTFFNMFRFPIQESVFARINERWEVGVGVSENGFFQVSFVNSICTNKGGTHVSYISEQIAKSLVEAIQKKNKDVTVPLVHVKNHLIVFVNCLIDNPSFDSQTKETLTTKVKGFLYFFIFLILI